METSADVIVVGLGAVGSAALLALTRRGVQCVGIDRFRPPHEQGSSHGLSRIIRLCYFEHPDYVPLLRESYRLWNQLQADSPDPILRITGGLYLGTPDDPFVRGSMESARAHSLQHELLDHDALTRRFPQFSARRGEAGFYEPTAGVLFPENGIAANLRRAAALGAQVVTSEAVQQWSATAHAVEVRTEHRTFRAASLILSAGAWMPALVPPLRNTLKVTRQVLAWFDARNDPRLSAPAMPVWVVGQPDGSGYYGFPVFSEHDSRANQPLGGRGIKLAHHKEGEGTDPDHVDRTVRPDEVAALAAFLRDRLPAACGACPELLDTRVCLYTSTPDHHFLLDLHKEHRNVVVVSACSGHGFKLSPAMGRAAADLATIGRTDLPIAFLGWR
ncbi:MAG TPA: N-methyl-L-tryptophan oxidase [Phycisphaerales bacterium]|nr:N-methyl-L-tryptophan oxidase [Phycisphaerales bacterium]